MLFIYASFSKQTKFATVDADAIIKEYIATMLKSSKVKGFRDMISEKWKI
jgi:hypothetical protein